MTIQDAEETAEFKVLEKPIIQKPLIAESDVVTIDNNLSTYVTGTQKRELTVGLGYLDSVGYETLRRIRDRQYAVLKYPTVTITADEPVDLGYGEDVPDYRQRIVQLKGKNLFDKDNPNMLIAYIDAGRSVITSNNLNRIVWIPCEPNTTYTVQRLSPPNWNRGLAWTETKPDVGVQTYGYVQGNGSTITITTGATAKYLVYRFYQSNSDSSTTLDNVLASVQIEEGPTATSYEAYFNIELCKIGTYQDYIYPSGGKWYLHKNVLKNILTGASSEGWVLNTWQGKEYSLPKSNSGITAPQGATCFCNYFPTTTAAPAPIGKFRVGENSLPFNYDDGVGGLDNFKAWLSTHNLMLYSPLATPTDTEITNPLLVAQLDALQNSAFDRWTKVETNVQESSLQPYLTVTQGEITGSGKEVMLEGTTEDLLDFVILGDTFQDGTPTPDSPVPVQTVNGDIVFDFSGPSGVKRYTMVGKMTIADQRIIDNCGTNEQVQVSFRESKQL